MQRGAESPELAGLIVQKYGYGLAKAANLAADYFEMPTPDLMQEVDRLVMEIDPEAAVHRQKRWAARSARIVTE